MIERQQIARRRAQLMVELFLDDLKPAFAVTGGDTGYDYLVGFANRRGGTNLCVVEYKSAGRAAAGRHRLPAADLDRMAHSNVPVLFLAVDEARDRLFYAWPADGVAPRAPVSLAEIDDDAKAAIRRRLVRGVREPDIAAAI